MKYSDNYGTKKSFTYNELPIELMGNDAAALSADHSRSLKETITATESRGLRGDLAKPDTAQGVKTVKSDGPSVDHELHPEVPVDGTTGS